MALCAILLLPITVRASGGSFSDVAPTDWFAPYVERCANAGVMQGMGDGSFAPEKVLSYGECRVLAYRLYDLRRGGDGAILPAPESWGYMSLTVDGETFEAYTDADPEGTVKWGVRGRDEWPGGAGGPGYALPAAYLSPQWAAWASSIQAAPATMTLNGKTYSGTASCGAVTDSSVQLSFLPDGGGEAADELTSFIYNTPPAPGNWWRDIAYTLSSQGLRDLFGVAPYYSAYDWTGPASRADFAHMLDNAAGDLEPINSITQLPDCADAQVLALYRAGVLIGADPHGSFQGEKGLSRAEAATMTARILDPTLRLSFSPVPLPTEGYTLTYLMDGTPDCGIDYPVCLVGDVMLTLDGRRLPWPVEAGVPSSSLSPVGDYCYMGFFDESTETPYDTKAGLIDRNGVYIVPPENGRSLRTYAVEGGFFTEIVRNGGIVWGLLDEQGQWLRELEQTGSDPMDSYPPKDRTPLRGIDWNGFYYADPNGTPVSQSFDWGSHITDDGQGFVGLAGKIYRIQFAG